MPEMTIRNPMRVGSTPHEAPEIVWELLLELTFDPRLTPDEIDQLRHLLWDRIYAAVQVTVGPHLHDSDGEPDLTPVHGRGPDAPLFPLQAGATRFTCTHDIVEVIETTCRPTDLSRIAYDARGHAYELSAEVSFRRLPDLDGAARAPMPDPEAVRRSAARARAERRVWGN
jgi:hypothetical protein